MSDTLSIIWEATIKAGITELLDREYVALVPGEIVPLQTSAPVTYQGLRLIFEMGFRAGQISPKEETPR